MNEYVHKKKKQQKKQTKHVNKQTSLHQDKTARRSTISTAVNARVYLYHVMLLLFLLFLD